MASVQPPTLTVERVPDLFPEKFALLLDTVRRNRPSDDTDIIRRALKGETFVPAAQTFENLSSAQNGMACSQLLFLLDGSDARSFRNLPHGFRLMPYYDEDTLRRRHSQCGDNGMLHQRPATGAVQHFGHTGFHAGSLTRGEYYDGNVTGHFTYQSAASLPLSA